MKGIEEEWKKEEVHGRWTERDRKGEDRTGTRGLDGRSGRERGGEERKRNGKREGEKRRRKVDKRG